MESEAGLQLPLPRGFGGLWVVCGCCCACRARQCMASTEGALTVCGRVRKGGRVQPVHRGD